MREYEPRFDEIVACCFGVADAELYRRLLASPAGFEHFALELGEPAEGDVPPETLAVPLPDVLGPVAERYGIEVVGPPRRVSHPEGGR